MQLPSTHSPIFCLIPRPSQRLPIHQHVILGTLSKETRCQAISDLGIPSSLLYYHVLIICQLLLLIEPNSPGLPGLLD